MKRSKVFIIAEAGVNHNGDVAIALKLADAAYAAGADAVKFQTFRAVDVVTRSAATANYQRTNTGATSQFDMIRALELDEAGHAQVAAHCRQIGIEFFSTPFSEQAIELLVRLGVRRLKIPSGEITNKPLLQHAAATGLPLLMSSGMANLKEVQTAVLWIGEARLAAGHGAPDASNLSLLHCTSAYPAPADTLNLRAIQTMAQATSLPVGYSDHSQGVEAALAAVALGACLIEKHLTLDRSLPGPDHRASADPQEFAAMVRGIRLVEAMLGDGIKRPTPVEANTRDVARRSVVLVATRLRGHVLTAGDLVLRRPGTGIQPEYLTLMLGRRLAADVAGDTTLTWDLLEPT
ncbi:N-acetylneuraminate synthase [Acidovorax sp. 99]|uniref:N-acetylneuraminate synthase n=1 Tax=Acidovorax sp. 99 TaxID=2135634 RepID=UPI000D5D07E7|nr:N-acetylneuraminate synthase [Acidovorax sp. 99]PVY92490.1 N-acetylneuraminate synthase [Acidovorax sp. 99]